MRHPQPKTQSLLKASLSWMEVMERVTARVWRYSSFAVILLRKVTSSPKRGEKASLRDTMETLNIELGMGSPVVALVMKPKSPSLERAAKVL